MRKEKAPTTKRQEPQTKQVNHNRLTSRQTRVVNALLHGPLLREEVDRVAGASNGPEVIRQLRARGFDILCELIPRKDRDGRPVRVGLYYFKCSTSIITH